MVGGPSQWRIPHSRYNGLSEEALACGGYHLLSRSPDAGADMFVKHRKSLFIFFQGHPEYDRAALLREYRRDSRRFLAGKRTNYPEIPRNYFDNETSSELAKFREKAVEEPSIDLLSSFPKVVEENLAHPWHNFAVHIYTNWLSYLVKHRV
jgi:homoserine O-succinyltransferase